MTDETRPELATPSEVAPGSTTAPDTAADPNRRAERAGQEPGDLTLSLTPRQILGGFALLAAAVVLLRRRGRSRSGPKD
jgi:hypothetical protein